MSGETGNHIHSFARRCCMVLRDTIRLSIRVIAYAVAAVAVTAATIIAAPVAAIVFVFICPFATVRWSFVHNESWWESWKACWRGSGDI